MRGKDGWDRKERLGRVTSLPVLRPIEGSTASLLRQVREIAAFLRYYNSRGVPDGTFDEMLTTLEKLEPVPEGGDYPLPEGDMEPAQALIWIFVRQLRAILADFGNRWHSFPLWYYRDVLRVHPLSPRPETVWALLEKNSSGSLLIEKGTPFLASDDTLQQTFCYRLMDRAEPGDARLADVLSLWYEYGTPLSPAREWGCVTALHTEDPRRITSGAACMFGHPGTRAHLTPIGFTLVSPSLLLREGRRKVTLTLEAENQPLTRFMESLEETSGPRRGLAPGEKLSCKLTEGIFSLQVSTPQGWSSVGRVTVSTDPEFPDDLVLHFLLPEEFPATVPCEPRLHGFSSDYPALRVWLQTDAWLYPYSWLKDFLLRRVRLSVCVEEISHLLVYNELGQLDTSKPFQPFGLSAGRGSWFAVGNYEMAIKPLRSVDLKVRWATLPDDPEGLKGYYRDYENHTDNTSFRIQPRFLTDHTWYPAAADRCWYLFATAGRRGEPPVPDAPLAPESCWDHIPLGEMRVTELPEDRYAYSIGSASGFLSLVLEEPAMGLGQERYRHLFTSRMIRDIRRRKELRPLNVPLIPVAERLTLSYRSEETIDLHAPAPGERNRFYHTYPLGDRLVFPASGRTVFPLIHSLPGHAHLLLGLRGVSPGERLSLYLCFRPLEKEIPGDVLPHVVWYYGDGYHWKEFPDLSLWRDTTRGLLTNGCVEFRIPEEWTPSDSLSTLWLRAAVLEHEAYVPPLEAVYIPVVELFWEPGEAPEPSRRRQLNTLLPGRKVPGITGARIVSPFSNGRESETDDEQLCRISEYVTHRGRALLPRDYEWMVLQLFPQVRKVKCLPGYDPAGKQTGVVSLVVVPDTAAGECPEGLPHASSDLLYAIRNHLLRCMPPSVVRIEVLNPVYEEIMVRGQIRFHPQYAIGPCRQRLRELCDRWIAPWLFRHEPPAFGCLLAVRELREEITKQEYVSGIGPLSLVRMSAYQGNHLLEEYTGVEEDIRPLLPHGVFVPFREHLFLSDAGVPFGLGEMAVDSHWVIAPSGSAHQTGM